MGLATAKTMAADGAVLVLNGRRPDRAEQAASDIRTELGAEAIGIAADVTTPGGAEQLVADANEHLG